MLTKEKQYQMEAGWAAIWKVIRFEKERKAYELRKVKNARIIQKVEAFEKKGEQN